MKRTFALLCCLLPVMANADLAGSYTCSGKLQSVVKANGKTTRSSAYSTSYLTLNPDKTSISVNPIAPFSSPGTWRSSGARVFLDYDQSIIARNALYGCQLAGASCTFIGDTYNYPLTANKKQNILKGTWKLNMTLLVNGALVNNNGTINVTCTK